MLERESNYFLTNKPDLINKYANKYMVIVGEEVVGVYNSENEAYIDTIRKNYALGSFHIEFCDITGDSYTQYFRSRVHFA